MVSDNDPVLVDNAAMFGGVLNNRNGQGGTEVTGVRASLLWQPLDELSATLTYVNQDQDQDGLLLITEFSGKADETTGFEPIGLGEAGRWEEVEVTNLVIEYDLGWGDMVSSTVVSDGSYGRAEDLSGFGGAPLALGETSDTEGFIQELRLSSQVNDSLQLLAGVYYENLQMITPSLFLWTGDPSANPFAPDVSVLADDVFEHHIQQLAAFGEISYDLSEELTLTLGGRWFDYDRRNITRGPAAPFAVANIDEETNEDGFTGKVNVAYTLDENSLIYAQWSQGFRLGKIVRPPSSDICDVNNDGIFDGTNVDINTQSGLDSDNLDNYELGGKFTLMDNRLVINSAIYHIDWDGIPLTVFGSCTQGNELNAGEARSQGLEIETAFHLSESLSLDLGVSYVDVELTKSLSGVGNKGDRLPYTPRSTASIGIDYTFSVGKYDSFVYANYAYVGSFHGDIGETSMEAGDYGKLNVRAGIALSDHLSVDIYGTNLTNSDEPVYVGFLGSNRLTPRQMGLDVRYQF